MEYLVSETRVSPQERSSGDDTTVFTFTLRPKTSQDRGVDAYDLVFSQKNKNHLPFVPSTDHILLGQDAGAELTKQAKKGLFSAIFFPENIMHTKILLQEIINREILSVGQIAKLGRICDNKIHTISVEITPIMWEDYALLGR